MRFILSLAAIAAVSSLAVAQTTEPQNQIRAWDQTTEYTTRGFNLGAAGFISQAFTPGQVMGWGDVSYIQYVAQDWDLQTNDPFDIVYVPLNSKGLPDYPKATIIIKDVKLPVTTTPTNGAYLVTHNLNGMGTATNVPFKLAATNDQWHIGWSLKDKPGAKYGSATAPDGMSIHMSMSAAQLPAGSGLLCTFDSATSRVYHQEIPRQEMVKSAPTQILEKLAWSTRPVTTTPVDPDSQPRSYRLDLGTTTPALSVAAENLVYNGKPTGATLACPNPNTGYAGLDPDFNHNAGTGTPRYDNPVWKVEAGAANANGFALLFWSQAILPKPIPIFGGNFHLDITDVLFGASPVMGGTAVALDTAGAAALTINLGPNAGPIRQIAASFPSWHAQALILNTTKQLSLTNVATMRPMLAPVKFVADKADIATPAILTRPSGSATFFIRNDGPGALTVKTYVKTQHFPQFDVIVPERTAIRVKIFGASTNLHVESKFTNATDFHYMWNY